MMPIRKRGYNATDMPQKMPVVRQMNVAALFPQWIAIASIAVGVYFCAPALPFLPVELPFIVPSVLFASLVYFIYCRIIRLIICRDHVRGMMAYKDCRFQEAISHFEASHKFFDKHRQLDAWRAGVLGVTSYNPYRIIALGNMAYCYAQLGNGSKAIELYELALLESPDYTLATAMLRMLRASAAPIAAPPPSPPPPPQPLTESKPIPDNE
jgi:tetratricopeptide (TPR) repeat protein